MTDALYRDAIAFARGRYEVRLAEHPDDIRAAQTLRASAFGLQSALDIDGHDASKSHILVREKDSGRLVCCCRIGVIEGAEIADSYAAQFYGLSRLFPFDGKMMELGRFCVHRDVCDPDVVRIAWAALTQFVDGQGIKLLFGCSSFAGLDAALYRDAFAQLQARHLAPEKWKPEQVATDIIRFADHASGRPDDKRAMQQMPPLLRTYLLMGGWVSDHAVVDRQLNTLHVFTGLEIDAIPENRKRLLRGLV